jgi:hypothetical protein
MLAELGARHARGRRRIDGMADRVVDVLAHGTRIVCCLQRATRPAGRFCLRRRPLTICERRVKTTRSESFARRSPVLRSEISVATRFLSGTRSAARARAPGRR